MRSYFFGMLAFLVFKISQRIELNELIRKNFASNTQKLTLSDARLYTNNFPWKSNKLCSEILSEQNR